MDKKNIEDFYPLSPMQQGMLFHTLYAPDSGVYVEQMNCTLEGNLNITAFRESWQQIINRHSILRTSFLTKGLKEPIQMVHRNVEVPLEIKDIRDLKGKESQDFFAEFIENECHAGFELSKVPLMRLALIQEGPNTFKFVWTYHHILLDGWSMPILLQEFFMLYESIRQSRTIALPLARPFRDYIVWLKKQNQEEAEKFWRKTLKGFTLPTPLLTGRSGKEASGASSQFEEKEITLSEDETRKLLAFANQNQITVNTVVQGAWALVLSRYSSEEDVLFGATVSGRPADLPGAETMMGIFINTLPVRAKFPSSISVMTFLKNLQDQQLEMRQYEYSSLTSVQGWSEVPRDLPLFNSILVFENYPVKTAMSKTEASLEVKDIDFAEQTNYPITVVAGLSDTLTLRIVYDSGQYDASTINRVLDHLRVLLMEFVEKPGKQISHLSLMTEGESEQILIGWNSTATQDFEDTCIHHMFERQVDRRPEAVALYEENRLISYGELNNCSNQLAGYLQDLGVGPETLVGICMERSIEAIIGILGTLKAGGAYLPVDLDNPPDRLNYIFQDAGFKVLLTRQDFLGKLPEFEGPAVCIDSDKEVLSNYPTANPRSHVMPENLAYVIYTSGSTGKPKGTLLQHQGVWNLAKAMKRDDELDSAAVVLQFFSLGFDGSVADIFGALLNGSSLYLPKQTKVLSPDDWTKIIRDFGITHVLLPPALLSVLPEADLSILKTVVSGGDVCNWDLVKRWSQNRIFLNAYGPTEATVASSWHVSNGKPGKSESVPIGKPINNVRFYILDKHLNPVPVGVTGELHITGVNLARGYLHCPDLTAEKFIPNPFDQLGGGRLYRTGDLARYLPDGNVEFMGRMDHQVKVRGFRVELGEIEGILKKFPEILDAAAVLKDRKTRGKKIVVYLVFKEGISIGADLIRRRMKKMLPEYMMPANFVVLEKMPLSITGKIDRGALPEPPKMRKREEDHYIAPRDSFELKLVHMWEEILEKERVGINDNFFDLGGHSLLAVRLIGKIREVFNKDVSLAQFFKEPTIEYLSGLLKNHESSPDTSLIIELKKGGAKEPLFFVHPSGGSVHWYADLARYIEDRTFYGIQARGIDGKNVLDTSIEMMANRYVDAILEIQPRGPYFLGGWSLGVIVAFELARQLRSLGHQVAFLGLMDQGPFFPVDENPKDDSEMLMNIFSRNFPLDIDQLKKLSYDDQLKLVLRKAKKAKMVPFYIRFQDFRFYMTIQKVMRQAWRQYEPKTYPGKIALFRSEEVLASPSQEADLGWSRFAENGVDIIHIPGDHISMLQEPHVSVLTGELNKYLRQLEESEPQNINKITAKEM
ncbi:MAG: amino acid adenylation domain-containing protein [Calditrichia bacterium]